MTEDTARKLIGGAAIAAGVGTFLPWVSVAFANLAGIEADRGAAALATSAIGVGLLFWRDASAWLQVIAATIVGGLSIWFWYDVTQMPSGPLGLHAHAGAGLYLTTIASVVWICLAGRNIDEFAASKRARRAQHAIAATNEARLREKDATHAG